MTRNQRSRSAKCALNRVKAHKGHSVLPGIERMKQHGKFDLDLSADTVSFIKKLEDYGAEYRYYEVSYDLDKHAIYGGLQPHSSSWVAAWLTSPLADDPSSAIAAIRKP